MRLLCSSTLTLGGLLLSAAPVLSAEVIVLQSGVTQTALLELYTSEGCSSCPPAEAWLSRLKESPKLWKEFVPVAFHVDYWDYLGWRDPYASKAFTRRQHDYAGLWRSRSVYTPGLVLEGTEWRGWSSRDELPRAANKPVGMLTARSEDAGQWAIRFEPTPGIAASPYEFHAALLGFDLTSDVTAGENRGRKLQHDFVVLALANAAARRDGNAFGAVLSMSSKLTAAPKRLGFAAWVTDSSGLQPLQAVGGFLSSTNL